MNSQVSRRLKLIAEAGLTSKFVWPKPNHPNKPNLAYASPWRSACARGGIKAVPYDLRRTFITRCAAEGKPLLFVAKCLDTSTKLIESTYAKAQVEVMQDIMK